MNYYRHHIGDFIRDTARLTNDQSIAYLRLIWLYYETEEALENDFDALAFKIGANASDIKQILKHFFFLHEDDKWHQSRCDKEILDFRSKSEKAKNSADARWNNANAMRTHTERKQKTPVSDANQEPRTNNQEPITSKVINKLITKTLSSDVDEIFLFWQARLRHPQSKLSPKRKKAIEQALKNGYTVTQLKHAITGLSLSEFHMAEGFDDITYAFRDTNIDKFISEATTPSDERRKKSNVIDFCNTGF